MEATLHQRFATSNAKHLRVNRKSPGFNCHEVVEDRRDEQQYIFVGSTNGTLYCWKWNESQRGRFLNFCVIGKHSGSIMCIMYHPGSRLLFTGSTDRCIKLWDVFDSYAVSSKTKKSKCIQTLATHKNSVTCLAWHYDTIFSGSVDGTVAVWKMDENRKELGLHPWFYKFKSIHGFNGWITSIWASPFALVGDQPEILVGDMEGDLTLFKTIGDSVSRDNITEVRLLQKKRKFRRLGIISIIRIQMENVLITLSNDHCARVTDLDGSLALNEIENSRGVRFTDMAANPFQTELYLIDALGTIEVSYNRDDCHTFYTTNNPGN